MFIVLHATCEFVIVVLLHENLNFLEHKVEFFTYIYIYSYIYLYLDLHPGKDTRFMIE